MKAVILAAGQGIRLRPLTDHLPKCLVKVNGKPILQFQLECLDRVGIQHCVIVVGYLGQHVQRQFGSRFGNMDLTYIMNERFQETNNLYSLWLSRHELVDDILLLEGDILFEDDLLRDIIRSPHPDIAVVDRFQPNMDGTVILTKEGVTTSMVLKSDQSKDFDYQGALKTVNIYTLCRKTMHQHFLPALNRFVAFRLTNLFYEAVMAQLISQGNLRLATHLTGDRQWAEIDTEEDLRQAEVIFAQTIPTSNADSKGSRTEAVVITVSTPTGRGGSAKYMNNQRGVP